MQFKLHSPYSPAGDQPNAIRQLVEGIQEGERYQTLLGVTGSGKTFTMANVIQQVQKPTLVLTHNKTLVAQLYGEFKQFFPENAVGYFVSYYDYYQPEAYLPVSNTYIEKDLAINEELDKLRLQATSELLSGRRDIIVVASPFELFSDHRTQGMPQYINDENLIFRMRHATEHYKKILNKPIWLGGISSGGVRVIATISGKDRFSDNYAGLIFSSTYVSRIWSGSPQYINLESDIKYEMNLPILVFQHARDMKPQQQPYLQEWFTKGLAKKNLNKTELILTTEGDPMITTHDGGHHWFQYNKEEVARVVEKFIMENSK